MPEPSEQQLFMLFPQIMHLFFSRAYTKLESNRVHPGQVPLLFTLKKHNGCSQRELVELLHVKPPTVTVMLNRMTKTGMVERRADPGDQRVSRIFMTPLGEEALVEIEQVLSQLETEIFYGFSKEEILLMKRLMVQIKTNLHEVCGSDTPPHCHEHHHGHDHML